MSTYVFGSASGAKIEREFPIGTAPASVTEKGVMFERVYTVPTIRQLSPMDRGDRPSISHQLPRYYGFGQRETCWKERMAQLGLEDTPHRRKQVTKANLGPKPRDIDRRSREAAAKAGALDRFDKKGRVMARSKSQARENVSRGRDMGDTLDWQ